jgi:hypothetical protein
VEAEPISQMSQALAKLAIPPDLELRFHSSSSIIIDDNN